MVIYQLIMAVLLPVLLGFAALRGGVWQRLGQVPPPGLGPRLWLHGASNGELTSARWVVERLIKARPGVQLLVTANSLTGRAMVAGWGLPGVVAALAPLDAAGAAGRVLDIWEPQALVIVENELWPSRIAAAHRRGVPVLVIGARMSERSAARWGRLRGLIGGMLARVDWLSAQDDASRTRFLALGLDPQAAGPVLALKAQAGGQAAALPFAPPWPRDRVLLAASTHEGEEAIALDGFLAARDTFDHLILAPRHPRRSEEVQTLLAARGIPFATRSKGQVPAADTPVHLADTLGEMPAWYAMAGACLIGGTFAPKGGHTPWEPARAGCAILHGPDVSNNAAPFGALDRAGAAIRVARAQDLGAALLSLTAERQADLAARAKATLAPQTGGEAIIAAILRAMAGQTPGG
ncbi:3-deoxy-D-manno-octulosonic acid transferase [Fuscibacter oryzae]|uniref:3-deoxy-D-manno-octulosonic acid transferase n=1 Tax=Fuscibacter oryzae TaxID=2803939 RepID=A0A8J7MRA5_9RHOB|nr:glycosyltransferase N-terminal domain-containing protein [Fuscibacter oryzae]MBL4927419.1 3-deoxy-D-manno-octulosonic acid transferase [Fuscibacter oryzae]